MSNTGWVIEWSMRTWMFGLVFGPEVWCLRLGPLMVGFDPEMWRFARITAVARRTDPPAEEER